MDIEKDKRREEGALVLLGEVRLGQQHLADQLKLLREEQRFAIHELGKTLTEHTKEDDDRFEKMNIKYESLSARLALIFGGLALAGAISGLAVALFK